MDIRAWGYGVVEWGGAGIDWNEDCFFEGAVDFRLELLIVDDNFSKEGVWKLCLGNEGDRCFSYFLSRRSESE